MKRIYLLCIAILGLALCSIATPVDQATAKSIASKFMGTNELQLATTYRTESNLAALFVFNTLDGYVIVSANDCETPIVGYSYEGRFNPNNIPVQMENYLQDFVERIQYGIENHIAADEATARQWELVETTGRLNERRDSKSVGPLLTEMWEQGCLYNSLCPSMEHTPCGHAEVGCVAVAMGQIMHYWRYPETGWGSHSYSKAGLTLSADFGNTVYDWDHMPDSLTDDSSEAEIEAVATLLFHCGVSVEMEYTTNGSGASSSDVPNALYRYFSYSHRAHREKKSEYNNAEWLSLLKHDLDLQRPVFYSGRGNYGGHAFVCDGYDDNDLLHFNWGWGRANGYFALGHLNPSVYSFNDDNYAIFDIIPQYEPCIAFTTAYPSTAGTIEGAGAYHVGDSCTLTATPTENYEFYCWKINGQTVSNMPSYTFAVEADTLNIEAHFSCFPVGQFTASYSPVASNPNSPNVSLSWNRADTEWTLLKQFDINGETSGLATDNEHIYVSYGEWNNPPFMLEKYTMDGELVDAFDLEGITDVLGLVYDGTSFYCTSVADHFYSPTIYRIDLDNKTVVDRINMGIYFYSLAYDPEYDGFWLGFNYQTKLCNRQGQVIITSPTTPDEIYDLVYFTAKDETPHLLISAPSGVYDYDITNNVIFDQPLLAEDNNDSMGTCAGKYDGKDALFLVVGNTVYIYEIKSHFGQIVSYRIYRADSEGHSVMLADEVDGTSFLDSSWNDAHAGSYRFGISEVYANGVESEIIWSDPIVKTDYGIDENEGTKEEYEPSVQKVIEDGHIVIIKDGKRYNVSGQKLN